VRWVATAFRGCPQKKSIKKYPRFPCQPSPYLPASLLSAAGLSFCPNRHPAKYCLTILGVKCAENDTIWETVHTLYTLQAHRAHRAQCALDARCHCQETQAGFLFSITASRSISQSLQSVATPPLLYNVAISRSPIASPFLNRVGVFLRRELRTGSRRNDGAGGNGASPAGAASGGTQAARTTVQAEGHAEGHVVSVTWRAAVIDRSSN
jgi:hypothetical protein